MVTPRMFHILVLAIICTSTSIGAVCPYNTTHVAPVQQNCTCTSVIYCESLQSIPPLDPASNITPVNITFQGGDITTVSKSSLPPGLARIEFDGHPLTNISHDAFETSSSTLKELSIQNAAFHELPKALLQLQNLKMLKILDTKIDIWDKDILKHIGLSLRILYLTNVSLSSWPSWISLFSSLTRISFSNNPLVFIPEDAFTSFENTLEELDLSYTGLTQIPQTANLPILRALLLKGNNISKITSDRLSSSLQLLALNDNNINEITDTSFPNNSLIKTLILSDNPISTVSLSAFKPLTQLSRLLLSLEPLAGMPDAVTSLSSLTFFGVIYTYEPFSCVCPPPEDKVRWYTSYNGTLDMNVLCKNNGFLHDYDSYLNGLTCKADVSTSQTVKSIITTDNNMGARLKSCQICIYVYMLGLLTFFYKRM